jgi:hypothetical protein
LLPFFGADVPSRTFTAKTKSELDFLLNDKVFNNADVIQVPEMFLSGILIAGGGGVYG